MKRHKVVEVNFQ